RETRAARAGGGRLRAPDSRAARSRAGPRAALRRRRDLSARHVAGASLSRARAGRRQHRQPLRPSRPRAPRLGLRARRRRGHRHSRRRDRGAESLRLERESVGRGFRHRGELKRHGALMTLVWFVLLVGGLITVHELGHLCAAKLAGVKVHKLSIGFGPKLLSWKRGDTEYALAAIPLGGFVKLLGEDRAEPIAPADQGRAFYQKPAWQRLCIILAGPAANLIFPILIFAHLSARESSARSATIGTVLAGQPAEAADLRVGDRVIAVDGDAIDTWDELNRRVMAAPGRELKVTIERPGQERPLTKVITPRVHLRSDAFGERHKVGLIGVAPHFRLPQVGVVDEQSAAFRAGLRSFDVITSIQ